MRETGRSRGRSRVLGAVMVVIPSHEAHWWWAVSIMTKIAMPFTPVSIDGMLAGWSLKNTPYRASIILGLSRSSTSGSLVRRTVKVISETYVGRMASSVLTVERAASRG